MESILPFLQEAGSVLPHGKLIPQAWGRPPEENKAPTRCGTTPYSRWQGQEITARQNGHQG